MITKIANHRFVHPLKGDGLRAKALRGSGWTIAGFGAGQVLRLGSNLILTRMLFPEAFGLMALAQVFLSGLNMLSDIGVGPSIIQNKRGDDPDFLATAWTMQVIRGFALFLGMGLLAYPASRIYHEPLLFPILILIGSTAVVSGFQSIGMATASRKMALGRLTMIDLGSQTIGIVTMVTWAWFYPTVWALVVGGVLASIVRVLLGHIVLGSAGNRFHFERSAVHEIFHFGKWIFVATALTYLGGQGLRLIQGYLVPMEILGLLSISGVLGMVAVTLTNKIGSSVLFPSFADIHLHRPQQLPKKLREARMKLFLLTGPIFIILIILGQDLVYWMYDDRYLAAGLYLVLSATSSAIGAQRAPFGMVLIATGDVFGHALIMAITVVVRISAIFIGFSLNGIVGMLIADIISQVFIYPFEAWRLKKKGLWMPVFDLIVFVCYLFLGAMSFSVGPFFFLQS